MAHKHMHETEWDGTLYQCEYEKRRKIHKCRSHSCDSQFVSRLSNIAAQRSECCLDLNERINSFKIANKSYQLIEINFTRIVEKEKNSSLDISWCLKWNRSSVWWIELSNFEDAPPHFAQEETRCSQWPHNGWHIQCKVDTKIVWCARNSNVCWQQREADDCNLRVVLQKSAQHVINVHIPA